MLFFNFNESKEINQLLNLIFCPPLNQESCDESQSLSVRRQPITLGIIFLLSSLANNHGDGAARSEEATFAF